MKLTIGRYATPEQRAVILAVPGVKPEPSISFCDVHTATLTQEQCKQIVQMPGVERLVPMPTYRVM
jgi:hypothetical protein